MRPNSARASHALSPAYAVALLALGFGVAAAAPQPPAAPSVVPPVGSAARFRIARTTQDAGGQKTTVSEVILRRKAATTLTLEGVIGGRTADLTVLGVGRDGSLQIPKNDKAASQDAALIDVVNGLNRVTELFAGENGAPRDGWSATLALPEAHGASAPVVVPVEVANANGGDFDLRGDGQYAPAQPASNAGMRRGGRHGGLRGGFGGPPGGGGSAGEGPDQAQGPEGPRLPFSVAVSVTGQVRHGAVSKVSIGETRTVTVESLPFVNLSDWSIEATK